MTPQQSIAHYKIVSKLGEGGMGAVYRATDTKLNRDVAIKVLPEAFAQDSGRMQRFEREAQVLAALNHPNIAAIYGIEQGAIVMELVNGDDLAGPIEEEHALPLIHQLIDALEYAHDRGIIHRDLKPANIKVTPEGRLKVLDFGLAKAIAAEPAQADPKSSPTLTMAATMAGFIVGTAAYMAPEQARGHAVDKRADIWAFGAVVHELLTGKLLFPGDTVTDTLAAVLRQEVDLGRVPPRFRRLLRACLERDPRRRMRDIGDARLLLEEPAPAGSPPPPAPRAASKAPWIVSAVFGAAAAALAVIHFRPAVPSAPIMRFSVPAPENVRFGPWLAMSPDGRRLGFTAIGADGSTRIWIRPVDSLEARQIPGTEATNTFFWSWDSRSVAFVSGGKLKRVEISGGFPQILCDGPSVGLGGSWSAQDVILFGGTSSPIMRVSASGGQPSPVTALAQGDVMHIYPAFLSDGRHFLYQHRTQNRVASISVGSLDAQPAEQSRRQVQQSGGDVSFGYAAPARGGSMGHLLFLRDGTLMAQPFDEKSLTTAGEPVTIAESISTNLSRAAFSASPAGVLAYRAGSETANVEYTWFDREGRVLGRAGGLGRARPELALSPDGSRLAHTEGFSPAEIAVLDLARGIDTRLSFNADGGASMAWSPDGKWIAYSSAIFGATALYLKDAANGAPERKLLQTPTIKAVNDWSRDGRFLVYSELNLRTGNSGLWAIADPLASGEPKPIPLTDPAFREFQAAVSPDSRWLSYVSDESGAPEIYVRAFPTGDGRSGRWRVSSSGGAEPRWRADGKELYYHAADGKLTAVDVTTPPGAAAFRSGVPHALFATQLPANLSFFNYDVAPDGRRFLLAAPSARNLGTPITLVFNWESALRK